jgi:HK97 gp10 family phage protein
MAGNVQWSGDKFLSDVEKTLGENLEKAAIYYKSEVKKALNRSQERERYVGDAGVYYHGLDPSAPGEAPKKLTGYLQRSIAHEMSADKQVAFVGSALDYAFFLEMGTSKMQARPFLRPTLARLRDEITKIIATGKR